VREKGKEGKRRALEEGEDCQTQESGLNLGRKGGWFSSSPRKKGKRGRGRVGEQEGKKKKREIHRFPKKKGEIQKKRGPNILTSEVGGEGE